MSDVVRESAGTVPGPVPGPVRGPRRRRLRRPRRLTRRFALLSLVVVVLALGGATAGLLLGASVSHRVGPVDATFRLRLTTDGETQVLVPPLGRLTMASHGGPVLLQADVTEVRADAVRSLIARYPESIDTLGGKVESDVRSAIERLVVRASVCALVGAVVLTGLVFRRTWPTVAGGTVAAVALGAVGGVTVATFRAQALSEPRFSGLLASAPAAFGDVRDIEAKFTAYRDEIAKLVTNVSKLYDVTTTLPSLPPDADTIRVLWVSDVHDNPEAFDVMRSVADQFRVDAVVDSGDLSDHGTRLENRVFAPIRTFSVPYVLVKGNHDSADVTVPALRRMPGVVVLDGNVHVVAGLAFAGIGDPRFTPDQTRHYTTADETHLLEASGTELADNIDVEQPHADVAVIHDPVAAGPLFGHVPLVLCGHLHHREQAYGDGTLELVQGSTGGAGLRALDHEEPTPLELSVLYFSRTTHRLVAYDDITVGGLGLTSAQIERHAADSVIADAGSPPAAPSPSESASPSGSASASASPSGSASGSASVPASPAGPAGQSP